MLLPAILQVDKCAVSHWFRIDKARRELGYEPRLFDRADTAAAMAEDGLAAAPGGGGSALRWMALAAAGGAVVAAGVAAYQRRAA